jgi:hypothetical protein
VRHPTARGAFPVSDRRARGITLKTTLKGLRAAYPHLRRSGAVKWTARNGLIFVEANDTKNPDSPRARIAEIKIGTCGSY